MPAITSVPVTGVEMSCSIVPRSHSRAIVSEVRKVPITAITSATTPGTIKLRLSRSSLNQVRASTFSTGAPSPGPLRCAYWSCTLAEKRATTACA